MIKWLIRMVWGCGCKFEPVKDGPIVRSATSLPHGHYYIVRCEKCGRMKHYNL